MNEDEIEKASQIFKDLWKKVTGRDVFKEEKRIEVIQDESDDLKYTNDSQYYKLIHKLTEDQQKYHLLYTNAEEYQNAEHYWALYQGTTERLALLLNRDPSI